MFVPQYEGLSISDILKEARNNETFMQHMPDLKEVPKLPKQWVCNVAAKVLGGSFKQFIQERIVERNEKLAEDKDLMISIDP